MLRETPNSPAETSSHGHGKDQSYTVLPVFQLLFGPRIETEDGGNFPWRSKSRSIMKSEDYTQLLLSVFCKVSQLMIGMYQSFDLPT